MTGTFRLFSRRPGEPLALLDHRQHGRVSWKLSVLSERRGKRLGAPRWCGQCGRTLVVGEAVWRPMKTQRYELRTLRICAGCVEKMGAGAATVNAIVGFKEDSDG